MSKKELNKPTTTTTTTTLCGQMNPNNPTGIDPNFWPLGQTWPDQIRTSFEVNPTQSNPFFYPEGLNRLKTKNWVRIWVQLKKLCRFWPNYSNLNLEIINWLQNIGLSKSGADFIVFKNLAIKNNWKLRNIWWNRVIQEFKYDSK